MVGRVEVVTMTCDVDSAGRGFNFRRCVPSWPTQFNIMWNSNLWTEWERIECLVVGQWIMFVN